MAARQQHNASICWRQAIALLALALFVHQFLMASPLHPGVMPTDTSAIRESAMAPCDACAPQTMPPCAAVKAALPLFIAIALAWAAILAWGTIRRWIGGWPVPVAVDWRWPPNRRRALLQVFRC